MLPIIVAAATEVFVPTFAVVVIIAPPAAVVDEVFGDAVVDVVVELAVPLTLMAQWLPFQPGSQTQTPV